MHTQLSTPTQLSFIHAHTIVVVVILEHFTDSAQVMNYSGIRTVIDVLIVLQTYQRIFIWIPDLSNP